MEIRDFQALIEKMYSHKDRQRGSSGTFVCLMDEVGELSSGGDGLVRGAQLSGYLPCEGLVGVGLQKLDQIEFG